MEMKQLSLNLDVPSVLHIKRESLDEEIWARWYAALLPQWSSASEVDSMTLKELPSGKTEISFSVVLPSSNIFQSELKTRLDILSS